MKEEAPIEPNANRYCMSREAVRQR